MVILENLVLSVYLVRQDRKVRKENAEKLVLSVTKEWLEFTDHPESLGRLDQKAEKAFKEKTVMKVKWDRTVKTDYPVFPDQRANPESPEGKAGMEIPVNMDTRADQENKVLLEPPEISVILGFRAQKVCVGYRA